MKRKLSYFFLLFFVGSLLMAQTSAPTNLSAEVEEWGIRKSVKLTWEHELSGFQVTFEIYKQSEDNGEFVKIQNRLHRKDFKDVFVQTGKTYKYFVVAKVGDDLSPNSDTVSVSIDEPVVLKGIISGVVTDENSGVGLSNAKLVFIPKTNQFHFSTNVITDSLGNYSVELKEGEYYIYAAKQFYKYEYFENAARISNATAVTVSSTTPLTVNIALTPFVVPTFYTVKGKVTDESGNPLRAKIKTVIQNRGFNNLRFAMTDNDGNYTVKLRENDTVIVYAEPVNFNYLPEYYNDKLTALEADVLVMTASLDSIDFVLSQRTPFANGISGTLKDTLGVPIVGNVTAFKVQDGHRPFKVSTVSDSTGAYSLTDLQPGKYYVFACSFPDYIPTYFRYDGALALHKYQADSLIITETSVLGDINFTLLNRIYNGNGMISGTVSEDNATPVNGAVVVAINEEGIIISSAVSDEDGNYKLNNLGADNYSLVASKFDYNETQINDVPVYENNLYSAIANVNLTPASITEVENNETIPTNFSLSQNYPNPFNPETTISFNLPTQQHVTLKVYDILGNEVSTLVNDTKQAGSYQIKFNASALSSGIYFYNLKSGNFNKTMKMTLIK